MSKVAVAMTENGPIKVDGPVEIVDAEGKVLREVAEGESAWLCRCGGSSAKPFCDGTHNKNGFEG